MMMSLLLRAGKSPTSTGRMARTTRCRRRFAAGPRVDRVAPQDSGAGGIAAGVVALVAVPVEPAVDLDAPLFDTPELDASLREGEQGQEHRDES